jgi:hypothetical protein
MRIDSTQTVNIGKAVISTSLNVTGTTSFDGSQGTAGQFLTSAGSGNTPTWTTLDVDPAGTAVALAIALG